MENIKTIGNQVVNNTICIVAMEAFIIKEMKMLNNKEEYTMYEYECLGCGTKFYSNAEYTNLIDIKCDICGDYMFYSLDELYQHFGDDKWLTQAYSDLEKRINEDLFNKL